ncbi:hypothetical protein TKK_0009428 [Trichogramma kaykai]
MNYVQAVGISEQHFKHVIKQALKGAAAEWHIFAVHKSFQLNLCDSSLCHERWTKQYNYDHNHDGNAIEMGPRDPVYINIPCSSKPKSISSKRTAMRSCHSDTYTAQDERPIQTLE